MTLRAGFCRGLRGGAMLLAGSSLLATGCITPAYGPPPGVALPPGAIVPPEAGPQGALPPGALPPGAVLAPGSELPPGAVMAPGAVPPGVQYGPVIQATTPPMFLPVADRDLVWDQVVDAVDDYFKIKQERRVKLEGDLITEGNLETFPRGGSTILEPWNRDSTPGFEKLQSTLQSIRRQAVVRVVPADGGFWVDVVVIKELEDVARPESGSISVENLRNDSSTPRFVNPITGARQTVGWIPLGRDVSLEQTILADIRSRFTAPMGYHP